MISLGELALRLAPMAGGAIPEGHGASLEATSYQASEGQPHASGSNVCEVEVDIETGNVKVINYSVAHDCGRRINPLIVEGQIIGGVVHGLGNALFEELIIDGDGQPQNTNFGEYLPPMAMEIPPIKMVHKRRRHLLTRWVLRARERVGRYRRLAPLSRRLRAH